MILDFRSDNYRITNLDFIIDQEIFNEYRAKIDYITTQLELLILDSLDYRSFKNDIFSKGMSQSNAYLFISGHLYEDLVHQIFEHVIKILSYKEIEKLKLENDGIELNDKISKLNSHFREFCSYKTMIYQNELDISHQLIQRIFNDIQSIS